MLLFLRRLSNRYKRAWLGPDPELGWRGEAADGVLWLEPNAWSILSGVASTQNATERLRGSIDTLLRDRSPIGSLFTSHGYPPNNEP